MRFRPQYESNNGNDFAHHTKQTTAATEDTVAVYVDWIVMVGCFPPVYDDVSRMDGLSYWRSLIVARFSPDFRSRVSEAGSQMGIVRGGSQPAPFAFPLESSVRRPAFQLILTCTEYFIPISICGERHFLITT